MNSISYLKKKLSKLDIFYLNTFFVGNLINSLDEIASEDHAEFYRSILIKRTVVFIGPYDIEISAYVWQAF